MHRIAITVLRTVRAVRMDQAVILVTLGMVFGIVYVYLVEQATICLERIVSLVHRHVQHVQVDQPVQVVILVMDYKVAHVRLAQLELS